MTLYSPTAFHSASRRAPMTDLEELSFRHLISQLQDENRQLREEAKQLRLTIRKYLNDKSA